MHIASGQDKQSDKMITITGKVLNHKQDPVEGAVIYIDNVKTTYKSKNNGSYKIKVSSSALNLEARSTEYGSCKLSIDGRTDIDLILGGVTGNQELNQGDHINEIVNNEGVKTPAKKKAKKMNTYSDIYQMIRAEVSGVVVSGRSLQIKQGHSFFGSSEPLLVVNGAIVPSIENINPLDVRSIEVLTGSLAAIYGVRGSNGVISITLINGSEKEK